MRGYIFDVPSVVMAGCSYLPLVNEVLLPGATISLLTNDEKMERMFRQLKASDDLIVTTRVDVSAQTMEPVGCLALVAQMIEDEQGRLFTVFAGVGRVAVGEPFMVEGEAYPRMDVMPIEAQCRDEIDAKVQLSTFKSVVAGLGQAYSQVVDALHRYANEDQDLSVIVDRLSGLVGLGHAEFLQAVLSTPDILDRFELLNEQALHFMARIKASGSGSVN